MADVIVSKKWYGSIGAAWEAAMQMFDDEASTATGGIIGNVGEERGCKYFDLIKTVGGDTYTYRYYCQDLAPEATRIPIAYVLQSPGWRTMPSVMPIESAGEPSENLAFTALVYTRQQIYEYWCGAGGIYWTAGNSSGPSGTTVRYFWTTDVLQGWSVGCDRFMVTLADASDSADMLGGPQGSDGMLAAAPVPVIVLNGADKIVQALQDIAHVELQTTIGNGAVTVLQKAGDLLTPP